MTEDEDKRLRDLFRRLTASVIPNPFPQDYLDLNAAGYLLIALGHLVKAKEKLDQEPPSRAVYRARRDTVYAIHFVKHVLKMLDELKEEPCEKS